MDAPYGLPAVRGWPGQVVDNGVRGSGTICVVPAIPKQGVTFMTDTGSELATQADTQLPEGLEDFDAATDAVMPQLTIDHKTAQLTNRDSGLQYPNPARLVILGLVKQRILWPPEPAEGDAVPAPLCKSNNFNQGHPGPEFPWPNSGFTEQDGPLPCEACNLKEWGSHPKNETPWCGEQHAFAVMINHEGDADESTLLPSVLTVQRSALKPSRRYISGFAGERVPMFTVWTEISLEQKRRGNVDYCVPTFARLNTTDEGLHEMFSDNMRSIRQFLQANRTDSDTDTEAGTAAGPKSVPVDAPAADSAPTPADSAPAAVDDEVPF